MMDFGEEKPVQKTPSLMQGYQFNEGDPDFDDSNADDFFPTEDPRQLLQQLNMPDEENFL